MNEYGVLIAARQAGLRRRPALAGGLLALVLAGCGGRPDESPRADTRKGRAADDVLVVDLGQGARMEFVPIRAGEFLMGSPDSDKDALGPEKPRHRVKITKDFYLGKYPVTQEQYQAVTGNNPSWFSSENELSFVKTGRHIDTRRYPVEQVTWDQAAAFCAELTRKNTQGLVFRLPTEAEWEYAARAGTTTRYFFGDEADELPLYAWVSGNSNERPHEVGLKKPSPWGLYDVQGNVWQWCADWFGDDYYARSEKEDPQGPPSGRQRVLRGSQYGQYRGEAAVAADCRSARRTPGDPGQRDSRCGFRVCARRDGKGGDGPRR